MDDNHGVANEMSGSAGNLVQAGSIGAVHFHHFRPPVPAQLPAPIRTLVNQKHVLAELDKALKTLDDEAAIVALAGARGSGKSTVGVYWMQRHRELFADGQLHANLGAFADHSAAPVEVLAGFLGALGVDRGAIPGDLDGRANLFRTLTAGRSLQILLDDAATAAQVAALLPGPGRSMVIVTGQGGFSALAVHGATFINVEPLEDDMAIELLRGYAGERVDADLQARDAVVGLCAGRAIALSVVGRLLKDAPDLTIADLLEELADPDCGITRVTIDDEPAIGAVLDAGYRRLTDLAQRCYRVLGLHPSGDGVSPHVLAAAVGVPEVRLRTVVRELTHGKRMVDQIGGRLVLDAVVREHARNVALAVDGKEEGEAVRRAFVRWYAAGAVAADSVLQPHRPWRARLFPDLVVDTSHRAYAQPREWMLDERSNLRAAVELAADLGDLDLVLHICVAQWWLYESQKHCDDLIATHRVGLRVARHLEERLVEALLMVQQWYAERTCAGYGAAVAVLTEAAAMAGDVELEATAIEGAGLARLDEGDQVAAGELLQRNLALARQIGDARRISLACLHAAKPATPAAALALLSEAWHGFRSLDRPDQHNLAKVLLWQGRKLGETGATTEAREHLDRALALMSELGRDFDRAQILEALGDIEARSSRHNAEEHYRRALRIYEDGGHLVAAQATLDRIGRLG